MSIIQALAMTVAEIPVFVYTTFGQVQPKGGFAALFLGSFPGGAACGS